ncbi:hypothetical protein FLONG3_3016 [Fusarium longipes]|uniref:PD-(D/E)XK nuclease-like domain-containing protein n=1 Tax=Fusarium longipes TaxID=694270 RepID=A0A395T283_9HYPO|nr:hypothetical protein FLONG3_3016 [Fusarium longipes]
MDTATDGSAIDDVTNGDDKDIIPYTLKVSHEDFRTSRNIVHASLDDDAFYTPIWPDKCNGFYEQHIHSAVKDTVRDAEKCHLQQYEKTGWNNLVYTPLIDIAVKRMASRPGSSNVDFAPCERASVKPGFRRTSILQSQVDYMFYIIPGTESNKSENEVFLTYRDKYGSVNFTDFKPMSQYPIGLSIKSSELDGEDPVRPEIHLAAWQSAHWYQLALLAGEDIRSLGFLPGIIIEGHDWKFVATTWKNGRTVGATGITDEMEEDSNAQNRLSCQVFTWVRQLRR